MDGSNHREGGGGWGGGEGGKLVGKGGMETERRRRKGAPGVRTSSEVRWEQATVSENMCQCVHVCQVQTNTLQTGLASNQPRVVCVCSLMLVDTQQHDSFKGLSVLLTAKKLWSVFRSMRVNKKVLYIFFDNVITAQSITHILLL